MAQKKKKTKKAMKELKEKKKPKTGKAAVKSWTKFITERNKGSKKKGK